MATRKKVTAPAEDRIALIAIPVLNVRKKPDDESPVVARIKGRGTPLRIAEEKDGWCKMANGLGWVRKDHIEHF